MAYKITEQLVPYLKFYSELSKTVNINELLPHFLSEKIINDGEYKLLQNLTESSEKMSVFLRIISEHLNTGNTEVYHTMLNIMEKCGNSQTRDLSIKIKRSLSGDSDNGSILNEELYWKTKHDLGTEDLRLYKLVIFGPPKVGKSSLFKVLVGDEPDLNYNSTGALDKTLVQMQEKVAISKINSTSTSSWHKMSIEEEIARLRFIIKNATENPKNQENNLSEIDVVGYEKHKMKVEEKLFQPSTGTPPQIRHISTIMACYDSGGQPEFFDVMPALTTIPTGNIMVFDLSKNLDSKIEATHSVCKDGKGNYETHYTTAELMKTAIANIQSYSTKVKSNANIISSESDTGRLLVVGTHLDCFNDTPNDKQQKIDAIEAKMCNDIFTEGADEILYQAGRRIIYPISNTDSDGRDEAAKNIRSAVEDMVKYGQSYKIPISWLLFQLEVQLSGKDYIEKDECLKIAKECYINENELDDVLINFHALGILLHYKFEGLNDTIFCKPQWLFDQLTELIKWKYDPPPLIKNKIEQGIFPKQFICNKFNKELEAKGKLRFENLLELFAHLKIMTLMPNTSNEYFMPALLYPVSKDFSLQTIMHKEHPDIKQLHDTMLVKFKSRSFPRGMFCCLVTHLAQNGWEIQFQHAYKDLIVFKMQLKHENPLRQCYVALFDKINYMAVQIYCKEDSHYISEVCNNLHICLKKLCKKFQMNQDFKFGFTCKDCKKFAGVELLYSLTEKCYCEECRRQFMLNHSQLAWFLPSHLTKEKKSGNPSVDLSKYKVECLWKEDEVYNMGHGCKTVSSLPENFLQLLDQVSVLLVTVNKNEYNAALCYLEPLTDLGHCDIYKYRQHEEDDVLQHQDAEYIIGKYGMCLAAIRKIKPGSDFDGAITVPYLAKKCFKNLHVIVAVGVACGVEKYVNICDVLVANKVTNYDEARLQIESPLNRGQTVKLSTSFSPTIKWPDDEFKKRLEQCKISETKIREGEILSGPYLVDNQDIKEELIKSFAPEAIGIEMEGAYLVKAEQKLKKRVDLMIVKAVCDFGDGKKNKLFQPTAALLAANCLKTHLDDPPERLKISPTNLDVSSNTLAADTDSEPPAKQPKAAAETGCTTDSDILEPSAKRSKAGNIKEYEVFNHFYSKILKVLPVENIKFELMSAKVITVNELEDINNESRSQNKANIVLSLVLKSLDIGITKSFYSLLNIMKQYGGDIAIFADKIYEELEE